MKKIVLLLICSGFVISSCSKKQVPPPPEKHVDVAVVSAYNVPYVYDYPAMVQGVVDYQVVPRVSGAVFKQLYTEGTYVKKDQPLYQIDPRPFELDLQNAQGQLIKDRAAMVNYKIIYDRYVRLYQAEAVSKQDLETQTINYQSAVGLVKTDEAAVNTAKLNLEYAVVRAPSDGYVSERQVTVGQMVSAFQTVMNVINSVDDMYIVFSMPENDRLQIQNSLSNKMATVPSNYKFRVDLQLADGTKLNNAGYVQFTDTRISLQNGVWNMRAYVDDANLRSQLLAGQFVHVFLNGLTYTDTFALPQEAIFRDDKGAFVYVVKDGKATKQQVTTGQMIGDLWIVKDGLTNGMEVVTAGGLKVAAGDKVTVDNKVDQTKTNPDNPVEASAPLVVTPDKANASEYKPNPKQRAVQIESSANIYNGKY
ncbi:MAG: efflux RND transporter periplasmic adaptor subunit [Burkholderiales bacterium]|nr:efflux RND transporter periplasmic adaptor subunit [Burkholderiales bacterium]